MASTRNKNTPGNFGAEEKSHRISREYLMYQNGAYGCAYKTELPGVGLNPAQIPSSKLSSNYTDIETFLLGINSTNLVNPAPALEPRFHCLQSANLFELKPVLMPDPLVISKNQRPF